MGWHKLGNVVRTKSGAVVPGEQVWVVERDLAGESLVEVDVYDEPGGELLEQPLETGEFGELPGWVRSGQPIDLVVGTGSRRRRIHDAAPTVARRQVIEVVTGELVAGEEADVAAELGAAWQAIAIETNVPARVRAYVSAADRAADAARPIGTDPEGDHGLIFDFVTTAEDLAWRFAPPADGYTADGKDTVPLRVQNLGGSPAAVEVTLTIIGEVS